MIRSDDVLVDAHDNSKILFTEELPRVYELIRDPWNLASTENTQSTENYFKNLESCINFSTVSNVIDFGCGVGIFGKILKTKYPHINLIGIDFDHARERGAELLGQRYENYWLSSTVYDENKILNGTLPADYPKLNGNTIFHSLNALYYPFAGDPDHTIEEKIAKLISSLVNSGTLQYVVITCSGFQYYRATDALKLMGFRRMYLEFVPLNNPNPKFRGEYFVTVFRKISPLEYYPKRVLQKLNLLKRI